MKRKSLVLIGAVAWAARAATVTAILAGLAGGTGRAQVNTNRYQGNFWAPVDAPAVLAAAAEITSAKRD